MYTNSKRKFGTSKVNMANNDSLLLNSVLNVGRFFTAEFEIFDGLKKEKKNMKLAHIQTYETHLCSYILIFVSPLSCID